MQKIILHLHIPRTSGTSLRSVFEANLGVANILDMNGSLHESVSQAEAMIRRRDEIKLITLHADYGIHRFLPFRDAQYSYCTMLRHPVEMLRSLYYFSLANPQTYFHGAACRAGSLTGWFESGERPRDSLTYTLAGYESRLEGETAARDHLFNHIDVFGITEFFAESVAAFCRYYGLPTVALPHLNASDQTDPIGAGYGPLRGGPPRLSVRHSAGDIG